MEIFRTGDYTSCLCSTVHLVRDELYCHSSVPLTIFWDTHTRQTETCTANGNCILIPLSFIKQSPKSVFDTRRMNALNEAEKQMISLNCPRGGIIINRRQLGFNAKPSNGHWKQKGRSISTFRELMRLNEHLHLNCLLVILLHRLTHILVQCKDLLIV